MKVKVPREEKERFRNRKNEITVNCQVAFDDEMKLVNLNARWPGSTHDARIFRECELYPLLESENYPGHLLGDSAYPLREYMLIPLANPRTPAEKEYQWRHIKTRNLVERSIGAWKRRFNCLKLGFQLNISTALIVICAVGVVWNFLKEEADEIDEELETEIHSQETEHTEQRSTLSASVRGREKQKRIIEQIYRENTVTPAD